MMRTLFPRQSDRCWLTLYKPKLSEVPRSFSSLLLKCKVLKVFFFFRLFIRYASGGSIFTDLPRYGVMNFLMEAMFFFADDQLRPKVFTQCRLTIPRCWDISSLISQKSVHSYLTLAHFFTGSAICSCLFNQGWITHRVSHWMADTSCRLDGINLIAVYMMTIRTCPDVTYRVDSLLRTLTI